MNTFVVISLILTILAAGFWLWMAWDLGGNNRLSGTEKTYWIIAFLLLNVFGAALYYVYVYNKRP
ncbi:MAG TPA: PLDc N-terminal domain-containing protein [Chloroflexia bacterium]|nr:PLDc N-terminal domain-containing protein [Chloroflexia bacterium]